MPSVFEKLNQRLAQIVSELEMIEDELTSLMKARSVPPLRTYRALRVQLLDEKERTPLYFCATVSGQCDLIYGMRTELSRKEVKLVKPNLLRFCEKRFGTNFKIKTVKVTVYSKMP